MSDLTVTSPITIDSLTLQANGDFTYTSTISGTFEFRYTVTNSTLPAATATGTLTFNVTHVNQPPVANNDTAITNKNLSVSINVLANDTDIDNDTLTITSTDGQSQNGGTLSFDTEGVVTYTPATDYVGFDSFNYTINDGNEGSATGTVTIGVSVFNVVNGSVITAEDTPVTTDVLQYAWTLGTFPFRSPLSAVQVTVLP